jgi:hypothetical protein
MGMSFDNSDFKLAKVFGIKNAIVGVVSLPTKFPFINFEVNQFSRQVDVESLSNFCSHRFDFAYGLSHYA